MLLFKPPFRYETQIREFVEAILKQQFDSDLIYLNCAFKTDFGPTYRRVGFDMILGRFAVRLWISWIDGKGLTASLWGIAGDERIGIREWVQTSLTTQYPKQRFADLRSSEFCFLREDPAPPMFPLELEPERIQRYLKFISDNLKLIMPKLVEFYRAKLPIVNAIRQYTQNMVDAWGLRTIHFSTLPGKYGV